MDEPSFVNRYLEKILALSVGLIFTGIVALVGIGYADHEIITANKLRLLSIQADQAEAKLERQQVARELKDRSEYWLRRAEAEKHFELIRKSLVDIEERLRRLERPDSKTNLDFILWP